MSYQEIVKRILSDAATSFNLRKRIEEDGKRDPLDAMNDAEVLHEVASIRLREVLNNHQSAPSHGLASVHPLN